MVIQDGAAEEGLEWRQEVVDVDLGAIEEVAGSNWRVVILCSCCSCCYCCCYYCCCCCCYFEHIIIKIKTYFEK